MALDNIDRAEMTDTPAISRRGRGLVTNGVNASPSRTRAILLASVAAAAISGCDGFRDISPAARCRAPHSSPWRPPTASAPFHRASAAPGVSARATPGGKPYQRIVPSSTRPSSTSLYIGDSYGGGGDYYRPPRRKIRYGRRRRRYGGKISVQRLLVAANVIAFILQVRSAILYLPVLNSVLRASARASGYGIQPLDAIDILLQMAGGSSPLAVPGRAPGSLGSRGRAYGQGLIVVSSVGPFTMDFAHQTALTTLHRQPHRLLTAGFLHGSIIHLIFNMRYLWTMPSWLEVGLGLPLYLSAYIVSIVTGNLAHSYVASTGESVLSLCLGSSGGICGLNGLMYVMLKKMGNRFESRQVFKNILWLFLFGAVTEGISNASHIGGFLGGAAVGILFGPNYGKSYEMRRKFSMAVDKEPADYRRAMGFGIEPKKGMLPLWYLWAGVALGVWAQPELRFVPEYIFRGFRNPGLLSGMKMTLG